MMTLSQIRELSDEAAARAREKQSYPAEVSSEDLHDGLVHFARSIPNLGVWRG